MHARFFFQMSLNKLGQMGLPTSFRKLDDTQKSCCVLAAELQLWEDVDKILVRYAQ
jgi:hypothetical protein